MAFAYSRGQLEQLSRPTPPRFASIALSADFAVDYATIWRTQPHVRTVVSFLGRNIAQVGLHVYERVSDTDRRRVRDSPLAALLRKPNDATTAYRLIDALVNDLGIFDIACWLKVRDASTAGLVRLPPAQLTPIGDSWTAADGVRLRGSKGYKDFSRDDVVLFHGYSPTDMRWGVSPMETLRQVLAEEYQATQYRAQLWRNGARFPGHIERPPDTPWADGARERFRQDWRGLYTGNGPGAGGTPILEDGMKFVPGGITPAQAQYLETRKLTREEVAAAYHIPLPMVGILDHATFSNIEEQHRNLYQDTLGPWLSMIEQDIALQLVPEFDTSGRVYVEFNLAEKLRGTFEEQARSLQASVGRPWMTADEARARMNLPSMGGDAARLVTPLNVIVGGQASSQDSGSQNAKAIELRVKAAVTDAQRRKVAEVLSAFVKRQGAAVLPRIGAGGDWWDAARWDSELTDALAAVTHTVAAILGPVEAKRLGYHDGYDPDLTVNFLRAVSERYARNINLTTKGQLDDQLAADDPDPSHVFEVAADSRATGIAAGLGTFVAAFATVEAVRQIGRREGRRSVKTWVTGRNPRPAHAAMNGQTVGIDETFSNGAHYPCDSGDPDDAGCNCTVAVSFEEA